ncbi:c-di-GMP phosphodiesterase [Weissella kandleri]|uniref:c-di-GMP phosphodiesterase n=1 Tax=Weissella kandleri TaxID=1616 RepID=UPI00387E8F88
MTYKYGYFIQKIIDEKGVGVGSEALLRYYDSTDGRWKFPENFANFSLYEMIPLLSDVLQRFDRSEKFLAINITVNQMNDPRYEWFIRWARGTIYPVDLRIEISFEPGYRPKHAEKRRIKHNLQVSEQLGVDVILEKIESNKKYLKKVRWMFHNIAGIKIPFSQYRASGVDHWVDINMGEWKRISEYYGFSIDVTELEYTDDIELADKLHLKYRQGYLIDKPNYGTLRN